MISDKCCYGCDFCEALSSTGDIGRTAYFEQHLGDLLPSRTIFESDHFAIIASLGQIVEGYLLIISKPHHHSMAHLPDEFYKELNLVYSKTRLALSQIYIPPIIFEHGPMPLEEKMNSQAIGGGSCVDHAHFHCVPISVSADLISFLRERFPLRTITHLKELKTQAERNMPYFFVETQEGKRYVFDVPFAPPSQYLRRLLSSAIGEPERWNWRIYLERDRVIATVRRLKNSMFMEL